jgi:hypothetical protein
MRTTALQESERIINAYLNRTGLRGAGDPTRRYLWTDAYAVLALLSLHRATGLEVYRTDAERLASLVHRTLGRHRADDVRSGWISGLSEQEGERHPTAGGLRIGKPLAERTAREPLDPGLEWERDGQYFHYLTKWMLALSQLGLATGDATHNRHAIELAHAAVRAFVRPPRMHWKMSIDLARSLVASMGQHDPLDGLVVLAFVRAAQHRLAPEPAALDREIELLRLMCARCAATPSPWATTDPLGLGGLLADASILIALTARGDLAAEALPHALLADAHRGLDVFTGTQALVRPLEARLAFRELGLALGLHGLGAMHAAVSDHVDRFGTAAEAAALRGRIEAMLPLRTLAAHLDGTWRDPAAQATRSWIAHRDINEVMLAASMLSVAEPLVGLGGLRDLRRRPSEVAPVDARG